MAVKIRLQRRGRKKLAIFDIVVADSRSPRDGKIIEKIGTYNPNYNPASIVLNNEKALEWVMKGAQPSDTARAILSYKGVMYKKHLQVGVLKGALKQDDADKKLQAWLKEKESQIDKKVTKLEKDRVDSEKKRIDAEKAFNKKREEENKKKLEAKLAAEEAPAAEEAKEEAPAAEEAKEKAKEENKEDTSKKD